MPRFFPAVIVTTLVLVLLTGSAFAVNNPIPGVDIIVRKNPGGIKAGSATTDDKGMYEIKNLEPGDYEVEFPGAISTSRSNIKKPGIVELDVELDQEKEAKGKSSMKLTIKDKKSTLSGVVSKAAPKK